MTERRTPILFATSNLHKLREVTKILSNFRLRIRRVGLKPPELQVDDIGKIALASCDKVARRIRQPVLVEDSGLFVDDLKGFPGVYSSFVYRTVGVEGLLRLMDDCQLRMAEFRSALAFSDGSTIPRVFLGKLRGEIALQKRGNGGFGFDPIFIPKGFRRTFAEMSLSDKC